MNRSPIFHRNSQTNEFILLQYVRNHWCPFYDRCLNDAAIRDEMFDCSGCKYKTVDTRELFGFVQEATSNC